MTKVMLEMILELLHFSDKMYQNNHTLLSIDSIIGDPISSWWQEGVLKQ
ncbi:MAG: hypothetical protein KDC42_11840 [Ignavibacteriae bacterium]|nr:hypothetical protein [Ignavibacteriota bacterium]